MSSPRGGGGTVSEVEELNRILEVERRLVLATQQNYRVLKDQHLQLQSDFEVLTRERDELKQEIEESKERFERGLQSVQARSSVVVEALEKDRVDRETRFEAFKAETLAELQRVYRKELDEQIAETEREKAERDEVVAENDRLIAEINALKEEHRDSERRRRREERRQREKFDAEMAALLDKLDEAQAASSQPFTESSLQSRRQLLELEERLRKAEEDKEVIIASRQSSIARLTKDIEAIRADCAALQSQLEQLHNEREVLRSTVQHQETTIQRLNRDLSEAAHARLDSESSSTLRESQILHDFASKTASFDEKLAALEAAILARDRAISELKAKLHEAETTVSSRPRDEERQRQLRVEVKRLEEELNAERQTLKSVENERQSRENSLKEERDRSERRLAEIRKELATSPETAAEVRRLRDELLKKDANIKHMQEHYRGLLKQMKRSLVNLEKRHRKTQEKLASHILI